MLNVTDSARAQLNAATAQMEASGQKLRLGPTREGKLAFYPDQAQDGDHVVEHDGVTVLVMGPDVAQALAGRTLDFEQRDEGPRFALKEQS